jgi:dTDP-4-dehydrorhamnose reductase
VKILICGSNGQLGKEFRKLAKEDTLHQWLFTDIDELDIRNASMVSRFFEQNKPELVVNCAAYTAVDKAESDAENAYALNRDGAGNLAVACKKNNIVLIHVSTDYVFSGIASRAYREDDPTGPTSIYGDSKLQGELKVMETAGRALIIRTSWLYSVNGNNFLKTMLRLGKERGEVKVVDDQLGSPTYAYDLALAIRDIIPQINTVSEVELFHYSDSGQTTWFGFAKAIFEFSGISCNCLPVTTAEFPTPVRRPAYSVMDTEKIARRFAVKVPGWKESLKACIQELEQKIQQ